MRSPEYVVLVGEPAAEIVALAQRERAQLIAMATHGLSGYRTMLLGSTTEKVLRPVTVPVLIAPPSDHGLPAPHALTTGFGHVLVRRRFQGRVLEGTPSRSDYRPDSRRPPGGSSCRGSDQGSRTSAAAHRRPQSCSVRVGRARGPATHVHDPGVDRRRFCYSDRIASGGNSQGGSCARCGADCHGPASSGTTSWGRGQGRSPIAC
jgi:hypothetical protein